MTSVVLLQSLRKSYGRSVALDGLDLEVAEGEVHGFLGPNGAGKTTTLRILLGLIRADGGSATVLGGDPWADTTALHGRLAYVPGDVSLWPNLTGRDVIDLVGGLRGGIDAARRDQLVEAFALDPSKKVRAYSKGNRQKVALVSALASDVELYLLDEPTSGLDPLMEAVFRDSVRALREHGRTVLLSSHILSEAEALCDRVTIIGAGRRVDSGALEDLRHLSGTTVDARVAAGTDASTVADLPGVSDVTLEEGALHCRVDRDGLPGLLAALSAAGVSDLRASSASLEELFLQHYRSAPT